MRLVSGAFACKKRMLRNFKNIPQERIVRNLATQSRHQPYSNILRSLKGSRSLQKSDFLQPVSPIRIHAASFLPFTALRIVGSVALNIRNILLLGGAAGGVCVYRVCRFCLHILWFFFTIWDACLIRWKAYPFNPLMISAYFWKWYH